MNDPAQPWIDNAVRGVRVAELLREAGEWPEAAFHGQQAVELVLKAEIIRTGVAPPRMHNLIELYRRTPSAVQGTLRDLVTGMRRLDQYYMPTRYPDAITGSLPGEQEANEAVAVARQVVEIVTAVRSGQDSGKQKDDNKEGEQPTGSSPSDSP
jgi:HEPN domain-containing protein